MKKSILVLAACSFLGTSTVIGCGDSSTDHDQNRGGSAGAAASGGSDGSSGAAGSDAGSNPCVPNPCDTPANQAAHKTRCLSDSSASQGYSCWCDSAKGYFDDSGLCCLAHSSNIGGKCVCDAGWVDLESKGVCLANCSEDSFDGLTGWCPAGKLCVQGICQRDGCLNMTYPDLLSCASKSGVGFCPNDSSDGTCQRSPCKSMVCSSSNPNGTCPNANESCLAGKCTASCSPNPCFGVNQNSCSISGGKPVRSCAAGTSLDSSGKCSQITFLSENAAVAVPVLSVPTARRALAGTACPRVPMTRNARPECPAPKAIVE